MKTQTKNLQHARFLLLATLITGSAHAAITVSHPDLVITDHIHNQVGADVNAAFYSSLTNVVAGNPPIQTGSNRFSLDVNDVSGQSFTLASAITLDSIYVGYNDQQSTGTFNLRIDVGNDGSFDYTYTVTLGSVGDLQTGGGNDGPFHFIQFDLSSANIALGAGVHSFSLLGVTDNGEGGFLIATTFANNDYAGGSQIVGTSGGTGTPTTTRDSFFAVTAVPATPGLLKITSFTSIDKNLDLWELKLVGDADTDYVFRSSTVLDFSSGTLVENLTPGVPSVGDIGGASNSVVTTDGSGDATVRMTLDGSPSDFVRAESAP